MDCINSETPTTDVNKILLLKPFAYFHLLLLTGLILSVVCFPLRAVLSNKILVLKGILYMNYMQA